MAHRISNYDQKIETMKLLIKKYLLSNQKCLIHCDYFLNNVLVNDSLDISAILDFSQHSAVGDPKLDIASVLTWNEIDPNVKQEDYIFLYDVAKKIMVMRSSRMQIYIFYFQASILQTWKIQISP